MFDLRTVLVGTLIVTGIAMLLAAPIGLASAIYLAEFAKPKTRSIVKPILEILAGIPSVVLGFFALTWISPERRAHRLPRRDRLQPPGRGHWASAS